MDDPIVKSVSETVSEFPREALRDSIADKLAANIVERQLAEIRRLAIQTVREALAPIIDQAIAEALAAVEREDDEAWNQWEKILGDECFAQAPVKN
jgi:hypothetical protein